MNNMVGMDLLGEGGRELKGMSVLLVFLYDLSLNNIAVESLLLPKQVSVVLFKFCGKKNLHLKP